MDFRNKNVVFFDLDGTVIDTGAGIKNGVRYTLAKYGIEVREGDTLDEFIGPPMTRSFSDYYGFSSEESVRAVKIYRDYYADKGIWECEMYPGIKDLFRDLKASGKTVCIATSKPERFASLLVDKFGLSDYVAVVGGATFDGTREKKADIINYVFELISVTDRSSSVLVGDRHYDIDGAKACGMASVGVLYGYGCREEFERAGADAIVATVDELHGLLLDA